MKILYIHGYGSNGNAMKAQKLQLMFPEHQVVSPTFDYDNVPPSQVFEQLQSIIAHEQPQLILGSSTGGYYALCCSQCFAGPIWTINPVRDIIGVIQLLAASQQEKEERINKMLSLYRQFDNAVFQQLHPADGQLHFALSTDDELLGDHTPILQRFPNHGRVEWMDNCGHRFFRFDELKDAIAATLPTPSQP